VGRTATNIAPINEVLAAGVLLLSGWDGQDFLDPMCGSGTFLAEAAMIACNIPANINQRICIRKMARLGQ
jgi:putative N6-adenine-specific DNA methylase